MYLVDTDVISEARKGDGATRACERSFQASQEGAELYLSAVTSASSGKGLSEFAIGAISLRHSDLSNGCCE